MHFHPVAVVPWNMDILQFMATGVIWSVSSANRDENRSRKGSRHVVPSGQIARSPSASSLRMLLASCSLLRVSATVLIGAISLENREIEYVTAVMRRPNATDRKMGSSKVLCEHTKRTPLPRCCCLIILPFFFSSACSTARGLEEAAAAAGGTLPLITTRTPSIVTSVRAQRIGNTPAAMRKTARKNPTGIQRRIKSARKGVGRCTRRPSWNTIVFANVSLLRGFGTVEFPLVGTTT